MSEGKKHDSGKPRWSLLPWDVLEWVVKVLTFGATKYEDNNWQRVENAKDRYESALHRHLCAHKRGEWLDQESNLPHLAHAMCCLIFWFWMELRDKASESKPAAREMFLPIWEKL